jgi:hypothetical protein
MSGIAGTGHPVTATETNTVRKSRRTGHYRVRFTEGP